MNNTIFMPQTLTDIFHAIVDTVSCIMHYGFDMLSDVFGHYNGIIGLKFQFLRNRQQIMSLFLLFFSNFAAHSQSKRLQTYIRRHQRFVHWQF